MGIAYRVDHEKRIIFVVWDGVVTAEDWFGNIERLIAEPAWPSIPSMLVDLHTVADTSSIEEAEIEHAIALFKTDPFSLFRKKVGHCSKRDLCKVASVRGFDFPFRTDCDCF